MANVNRPWGFRPVKSLIGAPWTAMVREYQATPLGRANQNIGDLYIGQPVRMQATDGGVMPVTATTHPVVGVVVGLGKDTTSFGETGYFDSDNLSKRYLAGGADPEVGPVGVVPAEGMLFEAQSVDATTFVVGQLADVNMMPTEPQGDRTTGNCILGIKAKGDNSDGMVRIVEIVRTPDNDTASNFARYIVQFTNTANAI